MPSTTPCWMPPSRASSRPPTRERRPVRRRHKRAIVPDSVPRIVIVGGGFGGLAAAKALRQTNARITLVDRENHHLFQPLLYQVATAVLSPGQIASPIRGILRKQRNTTV